jgi:glucose/mannose-6-phosphate isomerase
LEAILLDDLKYIHQRDHSDALGIVGKQWQQLQHDFGVSKVTDQPIENIVMAGMGGSAWPGLFLKAWPGVSVPFEIVSDYQLPAYVGPKTLFIASSYSGNTEETLTTFQAAQAAGAQIAVMASDGKLTETAKQANLPLFVIPGGYQPRMSSMYFWVALVQLLEPLGLIPEGSTKQLAESGEWLSTQLSDWQPEVPAAKNQAKQLAQECMGRTIILYSGPKLFPAANKWKICINENAKNLAWCNYYPEWNHNELSGWSGQPVDKPFTVVEIRSNLEYERIQKRFEVTERMLSGQRPAPEVVEPKGENLLRQLLWTMTLGDYVSIYLALLNGLDPSPVDLQERFKKELG